MTKKLLSIAAASLVLFSCSNDDDFALNDYGKNGDGNEVQTIIKGKGTSARFVDPDDPDNVYRISFNRLTNKKISGYFYLPSYSTGSVELHSDKCIIARIPFSNCDITNSPDLGFTHDELRGSFNFKGEFSGSYIVKLNIDGYGTKSYDINLNPTYPSNPTPGPTNPKPKPDPEEPILTGPQF